MIQTQPKFFASVRAGFSAFGGAFVHILLFELVFKGATALLIRPFFSFCLQVALRFSGGRPAFNEQIWRFFLSVPGVVAALVMLCVAVLIVYFEFAVIITLLHQAMCGQKPSFKSGAVHALGACRSLKSPWTPLFAAYALFLLPLVNMGVTSSLLPQITIPNFITGELTKTLAGMLGLLALAVLVFLGFLCLVFVLPAMVLGHCSFGGAVKNSFATIRAYKFKILGVLLLFVAAWLLLFTLPREGFDALLGTPNPSFSQALGHFGFSLWTPLLLLGLLLAYMLQILLMPLLLAILTACYLAVLPPAQPNDEAAAKIEGGLNRMGRWLHAAWRALRRGLARLEKALKNSLFVQKHKRAIVILLAILLFWGLFTAIHITAVLHDPIVIGHRGSAQGVENTLESIQGAIDAGADYAEVDILLSADGVPMVVHDTNLKRLSGGNLNIYDLTAKQLGDITLSQNGATGRISTLEEVVAYCEGKILLAVEYKLHGREKDDPVEAVMRIIEKSAYQKDCLFLSLDYTLVAQMKQRHPAYRTGYCVYGNVGRLTPSAIRQMDVDFLLVEEWMASSNLVNACRRAWVPVYVWTVNDVGKMDDYLRMGVRGLVTDHPEDAVRLI